MQIGQPINNLQGVQAQNVVLDPARFYPATRRLRFGMKSKSAITGLGSTDSVTLKQTGIISALELRISGTVVFGGTIAGTSMSWRWPLELVKAVRVSANGQANLINASGLWLKALQMTQERTQDRGVTRLMGSANQSQGTLANNSDDWGTSAGNLLGPGGTVAAAGTYSVDLKFRIPIAFDQKTLLGAVFAQTAQTNLTCDVDYETQANLLTLGGAATVAFNLNSEISGIVYTIPQVGNAFVIPDLSTFHQFVSTATPNVSAIENEVLLPGTGIGRQLMRAFFQTWSSGAPLAMTDVNYGTVGWRYGGNDTPEIYANGAMVRASNEDTFGVDLGSQWGVGCLDFCADWALRDAVDEGSTSDLRLVATLINAPTNPSFKYAQQTVFSAPVGA